jgi:hypothetical protein
MRWTSVIVFALFMGVAVESDAQTIQFNTSPVAPAAEGEVKLKKDNNNNYAVEVNVQKLVVPKKLTPPKDVYIVWIESGEGTENAGKITMSEAMITKVLKGSLKTVTSAKPTKVFITAEMEGDIKKPGKTVVLTTNSF